MTTKCHQQTQTRNLQLTYFEGVWPSFVSFSHAMVRLAKWTKVIFLSF